MKNHKIVSKSPESMKEKAESGCTFAAYLNPEEWSNGVTFKNLKP